MKKSLTVLILLLSLILSGCGSSGPIDTETKTEESVDSVQTEEEVVNDDGWVDSCYSSILPFTDTTFGKYLNYFTGEALRLVYSNEYDINCDSLLAYQEELNTIIDSVLSCSLPDGTGLDDDWEDFVSEIKSMKRSFKDCVNGVYDRDINLVERKKDYLCNLDFVVDANRILNKLETLKTEIERQQQNAGVEVIVSKSDSEEKAYRVARYVTGNKDVELTCLEYFYYGTTIEGKYYQYHISNDERTVLINVEDCSAVIMISGNNGVSFQFVSDGSLPAEDGDSVVPNIVGMSPEAAKSLLDSLGCEWEVAGYMAWEGIEPGLVCSQYPSAGNLLLEDTVVHITIASTPKE